MHMHDPNHMQEQLSLTNPDFVMYVPKYKEYQSDNVHL